jgi:hypothetical protein
VAGPTALLPGGVAVQQRRRREGEIGTMIPASGWAVGHDQYATFEDRVYREGLASHSNRRNASSFLCDLNMLVFLMLLLDRFRVYLLNDSTFNCWFRGGILRRIFICGALLALAGCTTTLNNKAIEADLKSIAPSGYTPIIPTTGVRVGRLYFSGSGRRPEFVTANGTVFNALCYDDFATTNALAKIDKYIVDEGVSITKKTMSGGLEGSAAVSTSKLKVIGSLALGGDASDNRTYVVEKVHTLTLTDAGLETVRKQIRDNCRRSIAKLEKANRQIVIVLSAQRADKATDTRSTAANGSAGGSIGGTVTNTKGKVGVTGKGAGLGGGFSHDVTDEYDLVYLSVRNTHL